MALCTKMSEKIFILIINFILFSILLQIQILTELGWDHSKITPLLNVRVIFLREGLAHHSRYELSNWQGLGDFKRLLLFVAVDMESLCF